MNLPINQIHRCRYLLAATMIFVAVAVPAYAYMLRDNDARTEEVKAALPEAKAPTALVSKAVNIDDVKDLVAAKAAAHGVPTDLARAVVQVESDYDVGLTGSVGEVGLMQIKYETARLLGYTGTLWQLYEPETNIEWGMRYLAGARRLADGDLCGTAMRYNGGHGIKRLSRATAVYCNKIKRALGLTPDPVPNGDPRDDRKDVVAARKDQSRRPEMFAARQDKPVVVKLAAAPSSAAPASATPASATPAAVAPAAVAPAAVLAERKIVPLAKPAKPVHQKPDDEADEFEVRIAMHNVSEAPLPRKRTVPVPEASHRANVAGPFRLADTFADAPDSHAWFAEPRRETVAKAKPVAVAAKPKPVPAVAKPKPIETAENTQPVEAMAKAPVQRAAHARPVAPAVPPKPVIATVQPKPAVPVAHAQPVVPAAVVPAAQPQTVAATAQPKAIAAAAQPRPITAAAQPKPVALAKTKPVVPAKPKPVETAENTTPADPVDTTGSIGAAPAQPIVGEPKPAAVAQAKPRLAVPAKPKPVYTVAKTFEPADAPLGILPAPQLFERPEPFAHARPVAPAKPRLAAPAKPKPIETATTPTEPADTVAAEATTVVGKTNPAPAPVKTVARRKHPQSGDGTQAASELPLGGGVTRGDRLHLADHTAE